MKRYVQELAHGVLDYIDVKKDIEIAKKLDFEGKVSDVLFFCKQGMISDDEAVSGIVNLIFALCLKD